MSDYKPLTDDELVNQEHAMFAPRGLTHSQMYALLLQQARRANALAAAAFDVLREPVDAADAEDSLHTLNEAVARYNGEDGSEALAALGNK